MSRRLALVALTALALAGSVAAAPAPYEPIYPMVSPDGTQIAWVEGATWKIWEAAPDGTGARIVGSAPTGEGISQIAWTKYGFVVASNFTLYLLRPGTKAVRLGPAGFTFTLGGARAASWPARGPGQLTVVDLVTRRLVRMGSPHVDNAGATLSPDGSRVAWSGAGGAVWIARVGEIPHRLAARAACPQWSPDGRTIAFIRPPAELWVIPGDGGRGRRLTASAACNDPGAPAWSADSSALAFERGLALAVADVRSGRVRAVPTSFGRAAGGYVWGASSLYATFRPAAREAAQDNCTNLRRLDPATLRGAIVVRGCR